VFHWDLYRLSPSTDWTQIDLPDQLPGEGITLVEWPERYPAGWPESTWNIHLRLLPDESREIRWEKM
jgi:tRNA A37 threonylcarbamoyladenosine biosynthesis protein TsaE